MSRITRSLRSANSSTRADGRLQQEELPTLRRDYNFLRSDIIDDDIDFTRNSGATQTNSSGLVAFAPHNLLIRSERMHEWSQYTYNGGSQTWTDNQADPFGGTNAQKVVGANADPSAGGWLNTREFTAASGAHYILSVWMKGVVGGENVRIDLKNGSSAGVTGETFTLTTEWKRYTQVITSDASATRGFQFRQDSSLSNHDFFVYGAQAEQTFDSSATSAGDYNYTNEAAYNGPRFDYSADGYGDKKGLLIEEARTNLQPNSNSYTGTSQDELNIETPVNNSAISPSGARDAVRYECTSTGSAARHEIYTRAAETSGTTYTESVYVKPFGSVTRVIGSEGGGTSTAACFDLTTGQIVSVSGLSATNSSITDCGNGWYRVSVTYVSPATNADNYFYWALGDEASTATSSAVFSSFNPSKGNGVYFWGNQREAGSFPTSLIPTYGSTATRSADIASVSGTAFSRFFKDTEGTIVADVQMPKGWEDTDFNRFYAFSDGTFNNSIQAWINASATQEPRGQVKTGGLDQGSIVAKFIKLNTGEITRLGQVYKTNDHQVFIDGAVGSSDTTVSLATNLNTLNIGSGPSGASRLSGWIRRLRYFNKKKTNTQVQKLTDTSFLLDKFKGAKAAHSLRSLRDGRDSSPVCSVRREYDNFESSYSAAQVSNGDLEKDFRSADQTTLPLNISCEADEMIVGGDFTNLITNGDFASASGWTTSGGATIASGTANWDGSQSSWAIVRQDSILPASGSTVTATFTVSNYSAGILYVRAGALATATQVTANGTYALTLPVSYSSAGDNQFRFQGDLNFVGSVDNVSVVEGSWGATTISTWEFSNGLLIKSGIGSRMTQQVPTVKGKQYKVVAEISSHSNGQASIYFEGSYSSNISSAGILEYTGVATDNSTQIGIYGNSGSAFSVDSISVKEVNPIATGFSTRKINSSYTGYAMRVRNNDDNIEAEVSFDSNNEISLDSRVKATSMNLLDHSENFGEWDINGGTIGKVQSGIADPFGGNNAWEIESKTYNYSGLLLNVTSGLNTGDNVTVSGYFRKSTSSLTRFGLYDGNTSPNWGSVDIAWSGTGVPSTSSSSRASNINYEAIGSDGWYRVSFTTTVLAVSGFDQMIIIQPDRNGTNQSVYAFGIQLEQTVYSSTSPATEKVTNGTFTADRELYWDDDNNSSTPGWWNITNPSASSVSNGRAILDSSTGTADARQDVPVTAGKQYVISVTMSEDSGGSGQFYMSDGANYSYAFGVFNATETETTFTKTVIPTQNIIRLYAYSPTSSGKAYYSDISIKEYDPVLQSYTQTPVVSDAHNSTSANNLREFCGKENKLSYSEDFSQSIYSKINSGIQDASQIVDPFGGNNAVRLAADNTNAQHRLDIPTSVGTEEHTLSVYAKAAEYGSIWLRRQGSSSTFNLENGTVISDAGNNNPTITPVGNDGWYRVSITNTGSANDTFRINFAPTATPTSDYAGDGTSGIYIFGAQLNTNSLKDYQKTSGTVKTADVHVVNWYDQGGGEDFVNDTGTTQPRIVRGSELVTDSGGKASVYFDDADFLENDTLAGQNRLDSYYLLDSSDDLYTLPGGQDGSYGGAFSDDGSSSAPNSNYTDNIFVNGATLNPLTRDNLYEQSKNHSQVSHIDANTISWTKFYVGKWGFAGYNFTGKISEMVFFPNMDSSPKRFPIEQNMMNHFEIYDHKSDFSADTNGYSVTDGTAMTFDTFTGNNDGIGGETDVLRVTVDSSTGGRFHLKRGSIETDTVTNYEVTFDYLTGGSGFNNKFWLLGTAFSTTHGTKSEENAKIIADSTWRSVTLNGNLTSNGELYIKATTNTSLIVGDNLGILGSSVAGQTIYFKNIKVRSKDSDGYVTTLYDQTGNNNHALQATAANQPQLVSGGDLIKSGGHPAWEFKNNNPYHVLNLHGKIQAAHLDAWFVHDTSDPIFLYPGNYLDGNDFGWVAQDGSSSTSNSGGYGFGNAKLYVNGDLIGSSGSKTRDELHTALSGRKLVHHQDSDTADWSKLMMGWYAEGPAQGSSIPYGFTGKFSEWIWFDSDESSNRTSIDTALNNYYNIYS